MPDIDAMTTEMNDLADHLDPIALPNVMLLVADFIVDTGDIDFILLDTLARIRDGKERVSASDELIFDLLDQSQSKGAARAAATLHRVLELDQAIGDEAMQT